MKRLLVSAAMLISHCAMSQMAGGYVQANGVELHSAHGVEEVRISESPDTTREHPPEQWFLAECIDGLVNIEEKIRLLNEIPSPRLEALQHYRLRILSRKAQLSPTTVTE